MKISRLAPPALVAALAAFGAMARAATLECYFDFTRYGSISPGATIVSNVHGNTVATLKPDGTILNRWGMMIGTEHSPSTTGVLIPEEALAAYTGDFTLQIWFVTSEMVTANALLYGGTTSLQSDNSLAGDQALFVGYNSDRGRVQYIRPVIADGGRWGTQMNTLAGTGLSVLSPQDYVITYDKSSQVITAFMNGLYVGTMKASSFAGLAALKGFAIGGVQHSAFRDDISAPVNIRSFLVYSGVLSPEQVAKIHLEGPSVSLDALKAAAIEVK